MRTDDWLAERLGRPCFIVEEGDDPASLTGAGFHQAKVPCRDVPRVRALEQAGFGVVDVNVTLRRSGGEVEAPAAVDVHDAREEDREAILGVAEHDYDVSRFHMDPAVGRAVAGRIKRDWAEAALDGRRGTGVLAAAIGGRTVGFLAVAARGDVRIIDLVAVAAGARGAGAGRALVARLVASTAGAVEVGTQVANVAALRFYERLGFTAVDSRYVLHRHTA